MQSQIENLNRKIEEIKTQKNELEGKSSLLISQIQTSKEKLQDYDQKKEIYKNAVELLTLVQQATKEKFKQGFEDIITYALKYVFNMDYSFELEFGKRGNLNTVDYNIISPGCKEPKNLLNTEAGRILDIVSLALRLALLETTRPKIEGFIVLDEPFKHVNKIYLENAKNFLKSINQKINRQIILVTHKSEFTDNMGKLIKL
jgi:DNA repair exonuclease SbcCD ATPase subunit